jgi:hypothetical protein
MGAISKNVLEQGEWCAPTRELKNSKLLKLVHQSRKIITDRAPSEIEVTPEDDVVVLVNRKPEPPVTAAPEAVVIASEIAPEHRPRALSQNPECSAAQYPVYRDRFRPLRVAITVTVPIAAVAAALFVFLAR